MLVDRLLFDQRMGLRRVSGGIRHRHSLARLEQSGRQPAPPAPLTGLTFFPMISVVTELKSIQVRDLVVSLLPSMTSIRAVTAGVMGQVLVGLWIPLTRIADVAGVMGQVLVGLRIPHTRTFTTLPLLALLFI